MMRVERDSFWLMGMRGDIKGHYDCIHEFSEIDYSNDLRKIDRPTLFIHGDDDQIVPIAASARKAVTLVPNGKLDVYVGGGHGLAQLRAEKFNFDLLAFVRG
jgi:non-heme chloroperoxidase